MAIKAKDLLATFGDSIWFLRYKYT